MGAAGWLWIAPCLTLGHYTEQGIRENFRISIKSRKIPILTSFSDLGLINSNPGQIRSEWGSSNGLLAAPRGPSPGAPSGLRLSEGRGEEGRVPPPDSCWRLGTAWSSLVLSGGWGVLARLSPDPPPAGAWALHTLLFFQQCPHVSHLLDMENETPLTPAGVSRDPWLLPRGQPGRVWGRPHPTL